MGQEQRGGVQHGACQNPAACSPFAHCHHLLLQLWGVTRHSFSRCVRPARDEAWLGQQDTTRGQGTSGNSAAAGKNWVQWPDPAPLPCSFAPEKDTQEMLLPEISPEPHRVVEGKRFLCYITQTHTLLNITQSNSHVTQRSLHITELLHNTKSTGTIRQKGLELSRTCPAVQFAHSVELILFVSWHWHHAPPSLSCRSLAGLP